MKEGGNTLFFIHKGAALGSRVFREDLSQSHRRTVEMTAHSFLPIASKGRLDLK